MLERLTITPVTGSAAVLGGTIGVTAGYRIRSFTWTPQMGGEPIPRFQESGQWPNYSDVQSMEIHLEGFIVGTSQSDYMSKRQALVTALTPPAGVPTARYHAVVKAEFAGIEDVYAQVKLDDFSAPLERTSYISSPFLVTWTNDYGYWRAVSDNDVVIV